MHRLFVMFAAAAILAASGALAEGLSALARVQPERSRVDDRADTVTLRIGLSQGVPYRLFMLDDPRRLMLDFNELDWTGLDPQAFDRSSRISAVRTGIFRDGWSRMVLDLSEPLGVTTATLDTSGAAGALLTLVMRPVSQAEFSASAGLPADLRDARPQPMDMPDPKRRQTGAAPLVVVLDPGHGGIDPGADSGGVVEAELMLSFARELEETLRRAGGFTVVLTRTEDVFVPLETRVSIARQAGADVFLSLHADALAEGRATGATIYTLAEDASDAASRKLAERHDRADLLAGVDLSQQDDVVATVLMDLARRETAPRSDRLADLLVKRLTGVTRMHKRPRLSAGFSVLKAPDIPSVLIELGFLSSPRDRTRITDAAWRQEATGAIRDALAEWARQDAAEAKLLRQ